MTEIRIAREEDMARILEIEHGAISPPWTEGALLGELIRQDTFFPLAIIDGSIAGFLILRRISDEGELFQIAVDGAMRRRGAGNILMRAAHGCACESGLTKVSLEVRRSNSAAIALYEKHGYKAAGHRKNYYEQPVEDALVMINTVF